LELGDSELMVQTKFAAPGLASDIRRNRTASVSENKRAGSTLRRRCTGGFLCAPPVPGFLGDFWGVTCH
jgi:hypothetical protein